MKTEVEADVDELKASWRTPRPRPRRSSPASRSSASRARRWARRCTPPAEADVRGRRRRRTGATGEADDDVVDAEIVDEPTEGRRQATDAGGERPRTTPRTSRSDRPRAAAGRAVETAEEVDGLGPGLSAGLVPGVGGRDGQRDRGRGGAGRWRSPPSRRTTSPSCSSGSPSGPPTCSGSRPSTPTTERRVERDREVVRENARRRAGTDLLPVLDDIGRAREHGELERRLQGGRRGARADVAGVGLERFGAVGRPVRPDVHEALSHIGEDPDVTETDVQGVRRPATGSATGWSAPPGCCVVDPPTGRRADEPRRPSRAEPTTGEPAAADDERTSSRGEVRA